jgi:hypothetical protein
MDLRSQISDLRDDPGIKTQAKTTGDPWPLFLLL